jgi:hypothetical protein
LVDAGTKDLGSAGFSRGTYSKDQEFDEYRKWI